ncbi:MAG: TolB family protein, partial [Gemmatimonadota bacterium]
MRPVRFLAAAAFTAATLVALQPAPPATAQEQPQVVLDEEGYQTPPPEIREAVLAPRHLNVEPEDPSPDGGHFIIEVDDEPLTPLALLARKHYNLGGLQVDPAADRSRFLTTGASDGYRVLSWRDGREVAVDLPDGAKVSGAAWSPDGTRLAFLAHFEDASYIYVADPATGEARRLSDRPVLATLVTGVEWSGDGRHLFSVLVPEDRGPEPAEPEVATTPHMWLTQDEQNELRTYPSLLETPHEFALLEHYAIGQLARLEVASGGEVDEIGEPAMIDAIDPSPDGRYVRVERIREPYSDIVPVYAFATVEEVWDLGGEPLAQLADNPVRDGADDDDDDGDDDRRQIAWRPDGQGLSFLQREPAPEEEDDDDADTDEEEGEDDEERPDRKDRVMQWLPPFDDDDDDVRVVYETENRIQSVRYSDDARTLFIAERDGSEEHLFAIRPDDSDTRYTIYRHDTDDFYDDPGALVMRTGSRGVPVVRISPDGDAAYLSGTRYYEDPLEDAPQPFLDRVAVETGETTRLFESAADRYEDVRAVLDDGAGAILVSRESRTEVPNHFVVETGTDRETRLTDNRDPTPDIT